MIVNNDLAPKIYIKARSMPQVEATFVECREFDKILIYLIQIQKLEVQSAMHFSDSPVGEEKLSNCLFNPRLRSWCTNEWFYNAIDFPWFENMEFVAYLKHIRLGHVSKLTQAEWGIIRSKWDHREGTPLCCLGWIYSV